MLYQNARNPNILCKFAPHFLYNNVQVMEIEHLYRLFSEHQTVTTDSRDCPEGSIFFALKGESFDGNRFAEIAFRRAVPMQ